MSNKAISLKSGECFIGCSGESIVTNLGSCIAVCAYDREQHLGGMIHFLLPEETNSIAETSVARNPLNYGRTAVRYLFGELKKRGSKRSSLDIYVVGAVLHDGDKNPIASNEVARLNCIVAIEEIQKLGLVIKKSKTEVEAAAMRLKFDLKNGDVFISLIQENGKDKETKKQDNNEIKEKVKVLIVDDSPVILRLLSGLLSQFSDIEIVGCAASADEAEKLRVATKPDVMTLDIHMPKKDGVTYLAELMRMAPMPVIMVSDLSLKETSSVMKSLELGAFEYIQKPSLSEMGEVAERLRNLLKEAKKSKKKYKKAPIAKVAATQITSRCKLIAIGASTGGSVAIKDLFSQLPEKTPPIVVVQHMPPIFTKDFSESLDRISSFSVREANNGDILSANTAYIAPGGKQMRVIENRQGQMVIEITDDPPVNRFKPSVDYLFNSVSNLKIAKECQAVLMTGMGDDGARGLLKLRNVGARTIAQDEESCVVFGMPKAAIDRNAAMVVLPLNEVAAALVVGGYVGGASNSRAGQKVC